MFPSKVLFGHLVTPLVRTTNSALQTVKINEFENSLFKQAMRRQEKCTASQTVGSSFGVQVTR
jgi:hypothetical protein